MAWTTVPTFTSGQILTAAQMNGLGTDLNELRGDWAQARRTSGDFTLNNTSWANLDTGLDLTLAADAGDVIQVGISALVANEATALYLDVVTIVSSTVTNSFATGGAVNASGQGIMAWRGSASVEQAVGGPFWYKAVSGDISGGNVTLRLRFRTNTAVNKTLYAQTNLPLVFTAQNHGPVEI